MNTTFSIEQALTDKSIGGNPFKITDFGPFITSVIEVIMLIAAIATLVYLFWGGLEWITSGGDKAGTEKAKSKLSDAIIGLFIVFAAWAIFQFLQLFLGFNITGGNSARSGTALSSKCNAAKDVYVKNAGCNTNPADWSCWEKHIIAKPCDNFYDLSDPKPEYWWNLHTECKKPAALPCP